MGDEIEDVVDDDVELGEEAEEEQEVAEPETEQTENDDSAQASVEEDDETEETEPEVEEEEEEEEEEEKLPSQYHRSSFKDIKEKYPNFFKDFPDMREVYFREREFTNIYATVEDAQDALSQSQAFQQIEAELRSGSTKGLIDALDNVDKRAVVKVAENFLPQVYQKSPDLYFHVINPILEAFVKNIYEEGEKTNNDNYKAAAMYVAQFAWNHTDMQKLGKKAASDPALEEERQRLEKEKANLYHQRFQEAHGQVSGRAQKLLINEIVKGLPANQIDNDYVRGSAVRDISAKVNEVLTNDPAHMRLMNSLWQKAQKEGFSPESRNRLVSTWLARVKRVLPAIRKEVLTQIGADKMKQQKEKEKKPAPTGGKAQTFPGKERGMPKKIDLNKFKSDSDFLAAFVEQKGKL